MKPSSPDAISLNNRNVFLEGPAGFGKTTAAAAALIDVLKSGVAPDRVLVLVPQVTLARPYRAALHEAAIKGGPVSVQTIAGVARQAVELFWPVIAPTMGFAEPQREPVFLNIETAQYYMADMVSPAVKSGQFDSVALPAPRITSQVLDNLNRAALMRFPIDEIAQRLTFAWGPERDSTRPTVYEAAVELGKQFRQYCLEHNLLDFSLMIEVFHRLLDNPRCAAYLRAGYDYLIADNVEEMNAASHDLIRWLLPTLRGALLVYDSDGGYRIFLGAEADRAYDLKDACTIHLQADHSFVNSPGLDRLCSTFTRVFNFEFRPGELPDASPSPEPLPVKLEFARYYPQMIAWTADQIIQLVKAGVPPREIAVVAPYLNDSLRFSLRYTLEQAHIPVITHRPSRSLRDEPVTQALITLAMVAHPAWELRPSVIDVSNALSQSIRGLDPVRARLLASIVYRHTSGDLGSFTVLQDEARDRITYRIGERYEQLREWLIAYRDHSEDKGAAPLDHFFSRLFGEVLSQPGFGFHADLDAGRIAAQLIHSAQQFRRTLYGDAEQDWNAVGKQYLTLIHDRLISALFAQSWQEETEDAVFIAPAFTFLMRNRFVDYQFWLDIGSGSWSERLEQPLTHPYILHRDMPRETLWTDDMEDDSQKRLLYRIVMGLARRCRKQVFLGIADLGESGFEARGLLLRVFQSVLGLSGEQAGG